MKKILIFILCLCLFSENIYAFFVTEEITNISSVDDFYAKLSTLLTLNEFDSGKADIDASIIGG